MNTRQITRAATGIVLTTSSLAHAHGSGSSIYHYLSSPDHVMTFIVLGLAALACAVRVLHKSKVTARQEQH